MQIQKQTLCSLYNFSLLQIKFFDNQDKNIMPLSHLLPFLNVLLFQRQLLDYKEGLVAKPAQTKQIGIHYSTVMIELIAFVNGKMLVFY